MRANRRDDNESEIVKYWRDLHYIWIPQGREAGFDGILIGFEQVWFVEIKNNKTYWKLTPAEMRRREELYNNGWQLHIVTNLEEAERLLQEV